MTPTIIKYRPRRLAFHATSEVLGAIHQYRAESGVSVSAAVNALIQAGARFPALTDSFVKQEETP